MNNWKLTKLENYVDLISGFPFKSEFFTNNIEDIPLIKGDNLHQKFIDWETAKRWNKDDFDKLKKYQLEVDDIVLAMDRPWIEAGLKYAWIKESDPKCLLVQRITRLRGKNGLETNYLRYIIGSPSFTGYIKNTFTGVTIPHISPKQVLDYKFVLPPLKTQQKIASILSAYDELIENNKQRIKLLEEMASEIYKEWFVRFRFPNYENTEFVDGLPLGWVEGKMGDIVEFKKGKNITFETVNEGNVPVVAGGLSPAYYHDTANTISPTITISASGASAGFVNLYFENIWASDCSFVDRNATDSIYFIYNLLKNRQSEVYFLQKGSAQPHVYPKDIMSLKLVKPINELIAKYEALINPMFEEIKTLAQKNQTLQQTRDLLLPRLISGKLSLEGLTEKESNLLIKQEDTLLMAAEPSVAYS